MRTTWKAATAALLFAIAICVDTERVQARGDYADYISALDTWCTGEYSYELTGHGYTVDSSVCPELVCTGFKDACIDFCENVFATYWINDWCYEVTGSGECVCEPLSQATR